MDRLQNLNVVKVLPNSEGDQLQTIPSSQPPSQTTNSEQQVDQTPQLQTVNQSTPNNQQNYQVGSQPQGMVGNGQYTMYSMDPNSAVPLQYNYQQINQLQTSQFANNNSKTDQPMHSQWVGYSGNCTTPLPNANQLPPSSSPSPSLQSTTQPAIQQTPITTTPLQVGQQQQQQQGGAYCAVYTPVILPNGQQAYQQSMMWVSQAQLQQGFAPQMLPQTTIQQPMQNPYYSMAPSNPQSNPQQFYQQPPLHPTPNTNNNMNMNMNMNNNANNKGNGAQQALFPQQNPILPARTGFLHLPQQNQYNAPHSSVVQKPSSWMEIYGSATADDKFILREWFNSVDQDRSGEIDEKELALALSAAGDKISESTIKLMMQIFDTDRSGNIDYYEFERLFRYIQVTREAFESYDYNRNGLLSIDEASHAISRAKFDFKDINTMRLLCKKFDKGNRGELTFENFLELVMHLGNWRTVFNMHDTDRDGYININLEEFIMLDLENGFHN